MKCQKPGCNCNDELVVDCAVCYEVLGRCYAQDNKMVKADGTTTYYKDDTECRKIAASWWAEHKENCKGKHE